MGAVMTRQRKAELLLILATAFWGISYYLTDVCFAELEPLTLNAIRFILAFLVLGAVMFPRLRRASRTEQVVSLYRRRAFREVGCRLSVAELRFVHTTPLFNELRVHR